MTNLQKAIKVIVVAAAVDDDDDAGTKASKYLASFMKCMKNSHTSTYLPTYLPTYIHSKTSLLQAATTAYSVSHYNIPTYLFAQLVTLFVPANLSFFISFTYESSVCMRTCFLNTLYPSVSLSKIQPCDRCCVPKYLSIPLSMIQCILPVYMPLEYL